MNRGARLFLALGCLAMLFAAGAAEAQYYGQNKVQYRRHDWRTIRSEHFEVFYDAGLDSLAFRVLDLAEKSAVYLSGHMGHTLTRRIPIILYASHGDFAQTNVTPELIDQGTGGFTEALRNRVVLPFTGSYEDLRHVVVHELVHAFMFDLLYQGSAATMIAKQTFYTIPLWFAEGLSEYLSLGIEPNAEMFLRDGTIEGYLPPLVYSGGYLVYKQGQSAVGYLVERFGEDRLRELLRRSRDMRNFDGAFERTVGMTVDAYDAQWRTWLKRRYWPTVAAREDPEEFARRLTDHTRDESRANTSPAVSPQGDRIVYLSDRKQYVDVYLMSALDGKVLSRVIRGERNVAFESIPFMRSAIAWSPDGTRLALTVKSGGRDALYIVSAANGHIIRRLKLPCDALASPAWSPTSDSLVVSGVRNGRSDLYLVDTGTRKVTRLTDDVWDEKEAVWTADGRGVTFASDRLAPVVLLPRRDPNGFGGYALYTLDVATHEIRKLLDTTGDDHAPAWSGNGRRLAFISDRSGTPNLYLFDVADSSLTQLTDVRGGIQSLSWSRQNDRLVFSAFCRGGYDVFSVREPLSVDEVVTRLKRDSPGSVLASPGTPPAPGDTVAVPPPRGALALTPGAAAADTLATEAAGNVSPATDTLAVGTPASDSLATAPLLAEAIGADSLATDSPVTENPAADPVADPFAADSLATRSLAADSLPAPAGIMAPAPDSSAAAATPDTLARPLPTFDLSDSLLAQKPRRYRPGLSMDHAGFGLYGANGFGVVGNVEFTFSDFLGDQMLWFSTDLFSRSIDETSLFLVYSYLPRRLDMGFALYRVKNYFAGTVTSFGEVLGRTRLFSESTIGAQLQLSYPFDRFKRVQVDLAQMFVDRRFFDDQGFTGTIETGSSYRAVTSPSISLIGDNTLFGLYGPVNGSRWSIQGGLAAPWFDQSLTYRTANLDARRYWDLGRGYTFAARGLAGISAGNDPPAFRVGGFGSLRGFPDFGLVGTRVAITNLEFRFPFIQQLDLVGPLPIGIFNLRGAAFSDFGMVWNEGDPLRFSTVENGDRKLASPLFGFGGGVRTNVLFMILKLETAWTSDFAATSGPHWIFTIGPEF
jgi:Tol biopolymer transport system component